MIFEVLSKSNTKADQAWRKRVYASVPNCEHYITVSLKSVDVTHFGRASGWEAQPLRSSADALVLSAIGVSMPLEEVYRDTPLGGATASTKSRRKRGA